MGYYRLIKRLNVSIIVFSKECVKLGKSLAYGKTCGIFNSINARTTRLNLLAYLHRNPAFIVILLLITAVQLGLIYYGGTLFRTAGLTAAELLRVIALSALVIPFDLLRKAVLRAFHRKGTV
jgi:hypothetical protein